MRTIVASAVLGGCLIIAAFIVADGGTNAPVNTGPTEVIVVTPSPMPVQCETSGGWGTWAKNGGVVCP